jgi:phosphatidylinositol alpha-1,6-mannosyltransferase
VLRALPSVLERVPDAVYLIVGSGPYRAELERLARELDLASNVVFAGFVPDEELPSYYRAADVVAVPSREVVESVPIEGFGIVYVEAGACGVPVVGGRDGGTDESIDDGVTGFRIDPRDETALADAVVRLLGDRDLARRFGRAGRDRAVQLFDWAIQAERLRAFLEEVADAD